MANTGLVRSKCWNMGLRKLSRFPLSCLGAASLKGTRMASSFDPGMEMPKCDFDPGKYDGQLSFDEAKSIRQTKLNPALFSYYKNPVFIWNGHMQWLFDTTGKRYLDLFAGIVTVSVGHCHPHVTQAATKQLDRLWHTTNIYYHPKIHEYAEQLTSKLPGDLKVCYFVNSGSEANDLAMLMARMHTGAFDIFSLRNAYHGASPYTMGLTSHGPWTYNVANGFGCHHSMNADVYRGPWGGANCRDSIAQTTRSCDCAPGQCMASDMYADQLEDALKHSTGKKVAAFFAEVVQGVGGTVHLPKGFLQKAYKLIRDRGGVCVSDEVQCGFGRMGSHYWGFETQGVVPDIVTMAKGIGNGFPMGAVVTTPEIAKTMAGALHFNTYGGNPVACAVGGAVMEAIEQDGTQKNSEIVGTYFLEHFLKIRDEFPEIVGDVRGKGLMLGIEMVKDKASRTPMPAEDLLQIWEECKDMGVLLGKGGLSGNVFRIKPPMCVTKDDADFAVAVLRRALANHMANKL